MDKIFLMHVHPLVVVLVAVIVLRVILKKFEYANLYHPDERSVYAYPNSIGLEYKDLYLTTPDGKKINAWYVPAGKQNPLMILCHGNGGTVSDRLEKIRIYNSLGVSVLAFDYRGFGKSGGKPSEKGTYLDVETMYNYAVSELKTAPEKLIIYGESLGCAVATELTLKKKAAALIFDSGFTSTVDIGNRHFSWLPIRFMVSYKYDNLAKIADIHVPVLVMHSLDDELIPFDMARRIFEKANEPKEFLQMTGTHAAGYLTTGARYIEKVREFLLKHELIQ